MSSSLYDQFGNKPNMMQQIEQLKKTIGNPEQYLNQMLQSGRINQNQINNAIQMAKQFGFFK